TLVSAAGLLIKSFVALHNVALGFRPENVLVARATAPGSFFVSIARTRELFKDMLARVGTLPGVLAAGATMAPPGYVDSTGAYFIDQLPAHPDWSRVPSVVLSVVAPGTFAALGIPLKGGRGFSDSDTSDRPFVAVVNEALVRKSFPNQSPLGRTIFCPFDSMEAMLSEGVAAPRFRTILFAVFAGLALCLAMAGDYGVMAFTVGQRSKEFGLRMALGASTGSVVRLVLGQGLALACIGLALGLAASVACTRLLKSMLFEVQPNDPLVYVAVALLLGVVALVAGYVPASRSGKIDPAIALRQE